MALTPLEEGGTHQGLAKEQPGILGNPTQGEIAKERKQEGVYLGDYLPDRGVLEARLAQERTERVREQERGLER